MIDDIPAGGTLGDSTATGLAVSSWGELFVADLHAGAIYRFTSALENLTPNGIITGVGLNNPEEIRFVDEELWIPNVTATSCATASQPIVRLAFDAARHASQAGTVTAHSVSANRGFLWVPASRDLYQSACSPVDTIQHYHVAEDHTVTVLAAIQGNGINNPHGLAVSVWGELFVSNFNSNEILRFTLDEHGDATPHGKISDSSLNGPVGMDFTPWGELVIVNQGNATLARFEFDESRTASPNGVYDLQEPSVAARGGFGWIAIVPGASSNLLDGSDAGQ